MYPPGLPDPCRTLRVTVHWMRNVFLICTAQLLLTLGLYWCLVDRLHLTIVTMPHITLAQLSDNVTIKDVARLFTGDGITIPQISDAFEWGQTALAGWSMGSEASREGMTLGTTTNDVPMEQGWGRPYWKEEKKFNTSQTSTIDMPHGWIRRQLNHSGMATQGRASVVDTALASSHSFCFNFNFSQVHMWAQNHANTKQNKKREKGRKNKYCTYYFTHN